MINLANQDRDYNVQLSELGIEDDSEVAHGDKLVSGHDNLLVLELDASGILADWSIIFQDSSVSNN